MTDRYAKGVMGEISAQKFLEAKGLLLISRRYKAGKGELDLVMAQGAGLLVFVEVKTRESANDLAAVTAVTPMKQSRMIEAALYFLSSHPEYKDYLFRFDVVTVTKNGVHHYPDAFHAGI